jgi:hypothetical protein
MNICNALWDLYLILLNLPKPYIYADTSIHVYPKEKLYRFKNVKLNVKDTWYSNDYSGWELPSDKHEGIEMELESLPDGKTNKFEISVNALYDYKKPIGRIMSNGWRHVRIPTHEEYEEGLSNLENHNYKVDYILTHTAPREVVTAMGYDEESSDETGLRRYFQQIADEAEYKMWFFGHFHEDEVIEDVFRAMFDDVVVID